MRCRSVLCDTSEASLLVSCLSFLSSIAMQSGRPCGSGGRSAEDAGRERDAASRVRGRLCYNATGHILCMIYFYVRRTMENGQLHSQTSSAMDVTSSDVTQAPLLRVYTFGAFHLDWQVSPFTTEKLWKSRTSARTLFKLLLCAPGRQASRSQLAGILWPETDEAKARESLLSACKLLRKVLRTASGEELLEQRNQNTILKLAEQSHLWVDADAFEDLISRAGRATTPDEALSLWQQAKALLRGEFLADDQGSEWMRHRWIKLRQQALRMARGRMVRHLADLYLQRGHVSLAEEVLEQQIIRFPTDQDALYRLLLLLEQQGYIEEACVLYQRANHALGAVGKQQ